MPRDATLMDAGLRDDIAACLERGVSSAVAAAAERRALCERCCDSRDESESQQRSSLDYETLCVNIERLRRSYTRRWEKIGGTDDFSYCRARGGRIRE